MLFGPRDFEAVSYLESGQRKECRELKGGGGQQTLRVNWWI